MQSPDIKKINTVEECNTYFGVPFCGPSTDCYQPVIRHELYIARSANGAAATIFYRV